MKLDNRHPAVGTVRTVTIDAMFKGKRQAWVICADASNPEIAYVVFDQFQAIADVERGQRRTIVFRGNGPHGDGWKFTAPASANSLRFRVLDAADVLVRTAVRAHEAVRRLRRRLKGGRA